MSDRGDYGVSPRSGALQCPGEAAETQMTGMFARHGPVERNGTSHSQHQRAYCNSRLSGKPAGIVVSLAKGTASGPLGYTAHHGLYFIVQRSAEPLPYHVGRRPSRMSGPRAKVTRETRNQRTFHPVAGNDDATCPQSEHLEWWLPQPWDSLRRSREASALNIFMRCH